MFMKPRNAKGIRKIIFLIFSLFIAVASAQSQQITGTVLDAETLTQQLL